MRVRRFFLILFTISLVACARRNGCDPIDLDLGLDFSGQDTCTPAGGTCSGIFCPPNTVPSTLECDGFLSGCCMPDRGESSGTSGGPNPPPPDREGTCNDQACKTGCVCRPTVGSSSGCNAVCDCSGSSSDAGGADADAGDPDAGDAGDPDAGDPDAGDPDAGDPDAGDPDGGDDGGDAGMSSNPGPPKSCGLITCAARCDCLSRSLSVCQCRTSACDP